MLRALLSRSLRTGVLCLFAAAQIAQAATAPAEALGRVQALVKVFDTVAQSLPRGRFDLAAAMSAGDVTTPEGVRDWIARETYLVPYAGRLRDAPGVLADRMGNSLDRALLAAAMLKQLGVNARLAHVTLGDVDATALLATVSAAPSARTDTSPVPVDPAPFVAAGIAAPEVDAAIAAQTEATAALRTEREARLAAQPAFLRGLAGAAPADLAATEHAAALEALKAHWWVQAEVDGAWVDLDPSAAAIGHPLTAAETLTPDALPPELSHTVTFRVVAEAVAGGVPTETVLVEHTYAAAEVATAPVTLGFEGGGVGLRADADGAALLAAATAAPGWLPRFSVAGKSVTGDGITTGGEVKPSRDPIFASDQDVGGAVAGGVGGAVDVLGGLDETSAQDSGLLTAMWLEVESGAPGLPAIKERRVIFDVVGAAARAAGTYPAALDPAQQEARATALMGITDIVVQTAATSPDQAAFLSTDGLRESLALIAAALASVGKPWSAPEDAATRRVPIPLYVYGASRFTGADGIFIARPNIAALRTLQVLENGELTQRSALDVLVNAVGVTGADPFTARIAQGVRDTVAEDQAFAFPADSGNASARHADYAAASIAFAPVTPASLPPDEAALAAAQAQAGYLVLAPQSPLGRPDAAVWWRIDPKTGETLGFGPGGYGATAAEEVSILVNIGLRLIGVMVCVSRLADAQSHGNTCGMVAGGLCLAGTMLSVLGVAGKALGEMGAVTANYVSSAGVAGGLLGGWAGGQCH